MGLRLLKLLKLLLEPAPKETKYAPEAFVSDQEFKALKYLHRAIYHNNQSPSVRDIGAAVGFRSSRSGLVLLDKLMERGFVYRDKEGKLRLSDRAKGRTQDLQNLPFSAKDDAYTQFEISLR
jgi:SOS-response transcriptional repressor LexA